MVGTLAARPRGSRAGWHEAACDARNNALCGATRRQLDADEVLEAFLALSGRPHIAVEAKLFNMRNWIAAILAEIDGMLSREKSSSV
jgi:hypothetical protein